VVVRSSSERERVSEISEQRAKPRSQINAPVKPAGSRKVGETSAWWVGGWWQAGKKWLRWCLVERESEGDRAAAAAETNGLLAE